LQINIKSEHTQVVLNKQRKVEEKKEKVEVKAETDDLTELREMQKQMRKRLMQIFSRDQKIWDMVKGIPLKFFAEEDEEKVEEALE